LSVYLKVDSTKEPIAKGTSWRDRVPNRMKCLARAVLPKSVLTLFAAPDTLAGAEEEK
jgi:hypothetical protein